jgi:serine/threonine protein kinase
MHSLAHHGVSVEVSMTGELLSDRYRLDEWVAGGGMGEIWQATDTVLGRRVAIKLLRPRRAGDTGFEERFRHEARAMAAFRHPGVADVYDYGETSDGELSYIVMAYVDGRPLDQAIAEDGRLDPAVTMSIVAQAARALHAAHEAGIVHRDVKPGNLILRPDGTVVLVDFGIARSAASPELTGENEVLGTAHYIAPEQVSKQPTGPATDVYALGAGAYHCLAGHPPFVGDDPIAVALHHLQDEPPPLPPDVPQPVVAVVSRAMAKAPADRFPTAAAMADAATAITARSAGTVQDTAVLVNPVPAGPPQRRGGSLLWALLLLALTGLGVFLAFAIPARLAPGPTNPTVSPHGGPSGIVGNRQPGSGQGGGPNATPTPAGASPNQTVNTPAAPGGQVTSAPAGGTGPTPAPTPVATGVNPTPVQTPAATAPALALGK